MNLIWKLLRQHISIPQFVELTNYVGEELKRLELIK